MTGMGTIGRAPARVAAAIRLTSPDEARLIEKAAAFARRSGSVYYVISVVRRLPDDSSNEKERAIVARNLSLMAAENATPVVQEGDDVPRALVAVGRFFGIETMFVRRGRADGTGISVVERLILLDPPFEVVVIGERNA